MEKRAGLSVWPLASSCGVCVPRLVSEKLGNVVVTNPYIGQATICAPTDLWFVHVDEDPRMTEGATTTIAGHTLRIYPSDRLFVNEVNSCIWTWL